MSKQSLDKNWLEWAVFAVGALLVGAVLAFLIYDGATLGDAPPDVEARTGDVRPSAHGFVVPVTIKNHGDLTAEGVTVEVTVKNADGMEEKGEFQVAFLPRRSVREGYVTFHADPRGGAQVEARVLGYEKP